MSDKSSDKAYDNARNLIKLLVFNDLLIFFLLFFIFKI